LGDLLLQTVYHTAMGEEDGRFSFQSVVRNISDKMVARHPHVFGDESRDKSAEQQTKDWEVQKQIERERRGEAGILDGVALGLPALTRALKLQKRAARVGFDWDDPTKVLDKLREEAEEIVAAQDAKDPDAIEDEVGDLLFVAANLARHLDIDPEAALRRSNEKFTRRFSFIEKSLEAEAKPISEATLEEMDALWDAAKIAERKSH
jgi:ATP diphosphatase